MEALSLENIFSDVVDIQSPIRHKRRGAPVILPNDFLRVPVAIVENWWNEKHQEEREASAALTTVHKDDSDSDDCQIEEYDDHDSETETECLGDSSIYLKHPDSIGCATNVPLGHRYKVRLEKDIDGGLGLTLKFIANCGIVVRSLSSVASTLFSSIDETTNIPNMNNVNGVAEKAGIQPGDVLKGVYGGDEATTSLTSLAQVGSAIKNAPSVLYLVFDRPFNQHDLGSVAFHPTSHPELQQLKPIPTSRRIVPLAPLASLLLSQGLFNEKGAEAFSSQLYILSLRSRQWQKLNKIIVPRTAVNFSSSSPGFLAGLLWGNQVTTRQLKVAEQTSVAGEMVSVAILDPFNTPGGYRGVSLDKVRPALVIRILGLSQVSGHTEYIVWVLDVLSGNDWKVSRRFRDFQQLEEDIFKITSAIRGTLDFPLRRLSHIYEVVPGSTALDRACKLSRWLRRLASLLPGCGDEVVQPSQRSPLVAFELQRFLEATQEDINRRLKGRDGVHEDEHLRMSDGPENCRQIEEVLSRVVHVYTHRILTLPVLEQSISDFVSRLGEQYENRDTTSTIAFDVEECMLTPMSSFIDLLQECILKGCGESIRGHLRRHMKSEKNLLEVLPPKGQPLTPCLEKCIFRGVRRAVESEVYVPLMGKLQRSLLGSGATDEDYFKANRRRVRAMASKIHGGKDISSAEAQVALGMHPSVISPSGWSQISRMLNDIDNRYALPCDRIAALVMAGRTISRIHCLEHANSEFVLGADDVLPVFIYALAGSNIRDLIAVRRLLHVFANPRLKECEEGYYLTTLDAAVNHISDAIPTKP